MWGVGAARDLEACQGKEAQRAGYVPCWAWESRERGLGILPSESTLPELLGRSRAVWNMQRSSQGMDTTEPWGAGEEDEGL